jgi:hypothetical protein
MRPPPLEILGVTPGENIKAKFTSSYESTTFNTFYILSVLLAPDARGLCFYIIHVPIYLECKVSTSSTAEIKFIDTPFRCHAEDKSTVSNTVGPATHLYALAEIISVPTDALSPQLATLLARQRIYTRSAKIISVSTDASSPQFATLLARQCSYMRSAETIFIPTDALSP